MHIERDLSLEEWKELLIFLNRFKHIFHCSLADVLNYGRAKFSTEAVNVGITQAEFDFADVAKAESIGQLTLEFREKHALTSEHYFVLSRQPAKDADKWAKIARSEKLTPLELKRSIEAGKVVRNADLAALSGQGSGINTIQGAIFRLQSWENSLGGRAKVIELPRKEREQILSLLKPTIELAATLEQSLADDEA